MNTVGLSAAATTVNRSSSNRSEILGLLLIKLIFDPDWAIIQSVLVYSDLSKHFALTLTLMNIA